MKNFLQQQSKIQGGEYSAKFSVNVSMFGLMDIVVGVLSQTLLVRW